MGFIQELEDVCSVVHCARRAVECCFECERHLCKHHLTSIHLACLDSRQTFLICPTCLSMYAGDHMLWPYLRLRDWHDAPHPQVTSPAP